MTSHELARKILSLPDGQVLMPVTNIAKSCTHHLIVGVEAIGDDITGYDIELYPHGYKPKPKKPWFVDFRERKIRRILNYI